MGRQGPKSIILLEVLTIGAVMMIGFCQREIRGVGVVIVVPMLTVCRKLAMHFSVVKNSRPWENHRESEVSVLSYSR